MKFKRDSSTIECPRCGIKCLNGVESCPECGLIFSRLDIATNKEAKQKILRRDRDFIIRTSKLPSDVPFVKLLLLAIFTGIAGGHCFYVGRYLKGSVLLLNFLAMLSCVIFNDFFNGIDHGNFIAAIATIGGIILFLWVFDIIAIVFKKFKVPVAIDLGNLDSEGK